MVSDIAFHLIQSEAFRVVNFWSVPATKKKHSFDVRGAAEERSGRLRRGEDRE